LLSSVKVNGEGDEGRIYSADDAPAPRDAYGRSKLAAETQAFDVARGTALEVVVLRVPLVYGPGVRANFLRLLRWVARGYPLPFGALRNRRSLLGLDNLCDLLTRLVEHPGAAGRVWMGSDDEDLSTPELVRRIAHALGVRARLPRVPESLLRFAGTLTGRGAEVARLCGSLQVDGEAVRAQLGWRPPCTVDAGLAAVARWFKVQEAVLAR
jgi:UDP-glucose 4-epimerase